MPYNSGIQALQNAIKDSEKRAEAAQSGGGKSLGYINWKPGEKKILRFLTDDMLTEDVYDFVVDNSGQTKNFLRPHDDPDRIRRYMSPSPGIGWRKEFGTNKLVEPKPSKKGICVAVVRTEKPGENGLQVEDLLYDKEIDGKTYPSRTFGIVMMGINNFWHTLATSCYSRYGSICTLDYEITRTGDGRDTKYSILPCSPVPELNTIEAVQQFYFYGQPWDENDELRFLKCPMTVHQWADYFSGEERYAHWLSPKDGESVQSAAQTVSNSGLGEFHPDTTSNDEAQAAAPPTSKTAFASLQDTLLKHAPAQS